MTRYHASRKYCSWLVAFILVLILTLTVVGCSDGKSQDDTQVTDIGRGSETEDEEVKTVEVAPSTNAETEIPTQDTAIPAEKVKLRVGVLKGPTGMGVAQIMERQEQGETELDYDFTIVGAPTDAVGLITSGDLDIALLPTNMAATLYNKTGGKVKLIHINTLGVMSIVGTGGITYKDSKFLVKDLKGKTIVAAGQGAAPEFVLNFILERNGLDPKSDVTIDFKSEHTEVASLLLSKKYDLALLAEPFTTSVLMQDDTNKIVFDLTQEWERIADNNAKLVMGAAVVRTEFLAEHPEAVAIFLRDFDASQRFVNADPEAAALLIEKFDIFKAAVAVKAIPRSYIVSLTGAEMKEYASVYLEVLFKNNPKSIGGKLPGDDFYYQLP
ncbi:MAG: ABC transporter substrate-binding protein [Clostridiaceae bacterium]|jgi:NitT/TauT family transport system substrate-binding protein|nr:ABC transporter substrate-binding protein [Clostridiaceae bacterium]